MSQHAELIHITTLVAAEGRIDDLIEAARPIAREAADAEGCFGAQLCEVTGQPGAVAMVSRWQRKEAIDRFLSENGGNVAATLAGLIAGPPTSVNYSSLQA